MSDEELRSRFRRNFASGPKQSVPPKIVRQTPTTIRSHSVNLNPAQPRHSSPPVLSSPAPSVTNQAAKPKQSLKKPIILIVIVLAVLGATAGGFLFYKSKQPKNDKNDILGQTTQGVVIPLYYPKKLPTGYTYNNDSKALKYNVFYSSVTGPNKTQFYITQQPIPDTFNFVDFNNKFLNPDTFSTDIGQVVAGQVGANTIGSIKTNKNTWVLINSVSANSLNQLEVVARSLEPI